jgi:hypothetical protein
MRLLRTASGGFLNVDRIERLDEPSDAADGWVAILDDGEEVVLAPYDSAPGRIERELPDLVPVSRGDRRMPATALAVAAPRLAAAANHFSHILQQPCRLLEVVAVACCHSIAGQKPIFGSLFAAFPGGLCVVHLSAPQRPGSGSRGFLTDVAVGGYSGRLMGDSLWCAATGVSLLTDQRKMPPALRQAGSGTPIR